jgi:hypothetical protein
MLAGFAFMSDTTGIYAIGCFVLIGGVTAFVISRRRHQRDLREYLEPVLQKCGVTYISAVYPGIFKVGPFPKFEVERDRPESTVGGISGEYNEYRVVSFSDSNGHVFRLWALVEFEMFQFRRVRWRAEQKDSLPLTILSLLENRDDTEHAA